MNKNEKLPPKKTTYTIEEWNEIEIAMKEEGFRNLHDYVVNMTGTRRMRTNAEYRRKQMLIYKYSYLFSIYNELCIGIDTNNNMERFMKGAEALCQELQ